MRHRKKPVLLNLAAASFELRIIEFFAEWSVALMPARHVLETRSPHLSFMLVEDSFKEFYLGLNAASLDRTESFIKTIQSRSLYGRHVSTSFLDPVFGAMMKQACRQTLKSLAAECLVGVRLGLLNFLTPVTCLRGLIVLVACIWCRWLFVLD